jgi:hypothetical protein
VTELERPGTGATATRRRARGRRLPWLLGGVVLALLKSEAVVKVLFHPGSLVAVMIVVLVGSVLRTRPTGVAVSVSVLAALILGGHSLGLGLGLGFGGFALLMALFFAVSTVLHWRQRR